jgi:hypothetical protein
MHPYVAILPLGRAWCGMKKQVLVPVTRPPIPCANHPSSFANDLAHTAFVLGSRIRLQHSVD